MPQLPDLNGLFALLQLFVAFLGAYLLAVWVSLTVWTFRDVRSRSRDLVAQFLAVLLVLIFNVAGLLLYFLLRPRETLAEKGERELAEEALLQDIQERQECPVCHIRSIQPDYIVCPSCHTRLRKKCDHCGRILNLKWSVCPYCGESQTAPARERAPEAPPPPRVRTPVPPPIHEPLPRIAVPVVAEAKPASPPPAEPIVTPPEQA